MVLIDYSFSEDEIKEFVNDPRLIALATIKTMNAESAERLTWEKKVQIKEMVGYLLNQPADNEQVKLIANRLLAKVYTQDYN